VIQALYASPHYAIRSVVIALKAIGALLYCSDARIRPTLLGAAPAAAPAPLVMLRMHANATPSTSGLVKAGIDAQEHSDESHRRIA
jgi:hypothetical protein